MSTSIGSSFLRLSEDVEEACVEGGDVVTCEIGDMVVTAPCAPCADAARFHSDHRLVDAVNHVVVAAIAAKGVVVPIGGVVDSAAGGSAGVVDSDGAAVCADGAAVEAEGALVAGKSVGACKVLEANADTIIGICLSRFGTSSRMAPELPTVMA